MPISYITPQESLVWTSDGRNCRFALPVRWRDENGTLFQSPAGAWTDWASTPSFMWPELPPFGDYAIPAGNHDTAYRDTAQRCRHDAPQEALEHANAMRREAIDLLQKADELESEYWVSANFTRDQSDTLFMDAMIARGVDEEKRKTLYNGVHLFGWKAFREDRM